MPRNKKIKRNKRKSWLIDYCFYVAISVWYLLPVKTNAAGWKLETGLGVGGLSAGKEVDLAGYVIGVYNVAGGIVGIVGVLMFMIGGFQYMIAAGKKDMSSEAKKSMINAVIGIALVLTARVVLGTINKELIDLQSLNLGGGNQ